MDDDDDSGVFRRFEKAPPDFGLFGIESQPSELWKSNAFRPLTLEDIERGVELMWRGPPPR